jgi:transposase-like protein
MSTTAKKSTVKGVRYTDEQKKEIVDFVISHNAANGRGGQSKAAEKFNISQITVAGWLKAAGAPAPAKKVAAEKPAKAAKAAKAPNSNVGTRYTTAQKQEVVDFVASYNAANGRGGQSKASVKFGVSPLTVMAWLKAFGAPKAPKSGISKAKKGPKAAKASAPAAAASTGSTGSFSARLDSLMALNRQIEKAEVELAALKSKFAAAKASL